MKKILLGLVSLFTFVAHAQDLVITEIMYNSPSTDTIEFIEIYNNTSADINLSGYTISNAVDHTFGNLTIQSNDYFVICIDAIAFNATFGFAADDEWNSGVLNNTSETIILKDALGVELDSVTYDDGAPWPANTDGQGSSLTLCDVNADNSLPASWETSSTNSGVTGGTPLFVTPGAADAVACSTDPKVSFDNTAITVGEATGTVTVTVNIVNENVNPTSADIVINTANTTALNPGDHDLVSTTTVTFPANSNTPQTITFNVVDDAITESTENIVLDITNVTNNGLVGTNGSLNITINDNDISGGGNPCADIFFSEYIEGSSSNKAVEIYNPAGNVIDLADYSVRVFSNGSSTPSSTISLSGFLVPGQVYVVANPNSDAAILAEADLTTGSLSHNGDDAIQLYNMTTSTPIDVVGEIGNDPGSSWSVGTGSTQNHTLIRMASVDQGVSVWTGVGDQEYNVLPVDDFSDIGMHTNTSCTASIPLTAYPTVSAMEVCQGDSLDFGSVSYGGTAPYSYSWNIGGFVFATEEVTYTFDTDGMITAVLTVTDNNNDVSDSTFMIQVFEKPMASITTNDINLCEGDSLFFLSTASGTASFTHTHFTIPNYNVNFSETTMEGVVTNPAVGTFNLYQEIIDTNGCMAYDTSDVVTVVAKDDASFSYSSVTLCDNDAVITPTITGLTGGNFTADQGLAIDVTTGEIDPTSSTTGQYDVVYSTAGTCINSDTVTIDLLDAPFADFTSSGMPTVTFTDNSTNATSHSWDFGDGNTSTMMSPTHTYTVDGVYSVCLTVTNTNGCSDVACNDITVEGLSIDSENSLFSVYPNPANNELNIQNLSGVNINKIEILDAQGKLYGNSNITNTVNIENLNSGFYFLRITTDKNVSTVAFQKK